MSSASVTESTLKYPVTSPDPYWMWKSDPSAVYEDDFPLSYLSLPPLMNQYPQLWQSTFGTQ